jgi:molybdopterin-containing oxidoreductase family membrane subunit
MLNRMVGGSAWAYWLMVACNAAIPQLLWCRRLRQNLWVLLAVSLLVNVGMWFERFVIVVLSLSRDSLPSSWHAFRPTAVDLFTLAGSFGLFLTLFLLFLRFLPMVAMAEIKDLLSRLRLEPSTGQPRGHAHPEFAGATLEGLAPAMTCEGDADA